MGPLADAEFFELVRQGTITGDTKVWKDGMPEWVPYSDLDAQAARTSGGLFCSECGKRFGQHELIRISDRLVCAHCKLIVIQRRQEGGMVSSKLSYAGFLIRVAARLIDGIILNVLQFVVKFRLTDVQGIDPAEIQLMALAALAVIGALYETLFLGRFGATPGKMLLQIRVVRPDGEPIGYLRACGRHFSTILSSLILGIGYLMAAFDNKEHRALHDRICNTRVIHG